MCWHAYCIILVMNDTKQKEKELAKLVTQYNAYNRNSDGLYIFMVAEYANINDSLVSTIQVSINAESESKALIELIGRVTEYNRVSTSTFRQIA